MATTVTSANEVVEEILKSGSKSFRQLKLQGFDFRPYKNLQGADFRQASVPWCRFDGCNLRYANFEHANCYGTNFDESDLHRANFKNADISEAIMTASDMFGITLTMECSSFKGVVLKPGWYWGFAFYLLLMKPPSKEAEDAIIKAMGVERYTVLREQYCRRRM